MSQRNGGVKTRAFKAVFPKVLPICISFFFLAMSYGVLMGTRGFSFLWPLCMSAFIYTGSMEFVTVNLLVSAFNPFATLMLALMMGTRHLFYGLSMLGRFKNMGAKKPYLIYAMCDETFAVNNSAQIPADVDRGWFYFFVSLLNQVSWVAGATLRHCRRAIDVRHHRFGFRDDRIVCDYFRGSMVDNETQKPYGGVDGHCGAGDLHGAVRC